FPEYRLLHPPYRFRANRDRNLTGGDPHLHHADLGRLLGVSDPWRAVERLARHFAPTLHYRIDGAGLSADRIERPDRPCFCTGDRGELGSRYGLFEMGADRRRSNGNRGMATRRRISGHRRWSVLV